MMVAMGTTHTEISTDLGQWIEKQKVFFVATAPLSRDGHINCSPKGGDTFRVLGPSEAAFLDLTGSGAETIAHLKENRRIVIMFCAFEGEAMIVRLHGEGESIIPSDPRFAELIKKFPANPGVRSIIHIAVSRVSSSCGMAVPFMNFQSHRDELDRWAEEKGPVKLVEYQRRKNAESIDGLPALKPL
ncbi:MAG TPA: pyridoxamine 5'-phosphate oxidase family protein [Kiritimatiellia bacterium]|nr:pyridoxamine 5'-phosphate oxidase family protein [Kiritimatiellia bacterium]